MRHTRIPPMGRRGSYLLTTVLIVAAPAMAAGPRLLVTPGRLAAIQKQIAVAGSHHQLAWKAMKARVDAPDLGAAYNDPIDVYKLSYKAREAAMLSLVASSPPEKQKYARVAYEQVEKICKEKGKRRIDSGYGLGRAMLSIGVGIAYDWCRDQWTADERAFVEAAMKRALQAWTKYGHANLGDVKGSNWVAVCRGGEMIMLLASGADATNARYRKLKRDLIAHMKNGFGSLGVSQEGVGYTEYPGGFLLPAVYAAASIGDDEMLKVARTRVWWTLAMYSHNFMDHSRKFVQTGVAHSSNYDEGWASLLLNLCPGEQLPHFLWWYDRHMGRLAPGTPRNQFDSARAGTAWSLLYYPADVKATDPTGLVPAAVADDHGYFFFRNRWKDADDIQVTIMADTHHHGHAWDQPEQMAINLMGYDTRFIGGPGKTRDAKVFSTLLVDGKWSSKKATSMTGKRIAFEAGKAGGYAIVGGGSLLTQLGVNDARRHMLVDFSLPDGAIVSTLDVIKSASQHTYTWQANMGSDRDDGEVKVSSGSEGGRPVFVLKGRNGFVKGWVLHPADAKVTAGDPLQIEASGADATIWVAMLVGAGEAPAGRISGSDMQTKLTVRRKTVSFDGARVTTR